MSKDIRSYFGVQVSKSKKDDHRPTSTSSTNARDSDVIPPTPTPKKHKTKNKRKIVSDSDDSEEEFKKKKSPKKAEAKPPPKTLKEVKAVDIFGSTPAKRSNASNKTTSKPASNGNNGTELGVHGDRAFEKVLVALDKDHKNRSESKNVNNSNTHSKNLAGNGSVRSPEKRKRESSKEKIPEKKNTNTPEKSNITNNLEKKKKISKIDTDFSSFVCDDIQKDKTPKKTVHNSTVDTSPLPLETANHGKRKRKLSEDTQEITEEERQERKRHSALLYKNFLNRSGPKNLGSKDVPKGTPTCLQGCAFVITGVLESFERDEIVTIIKDHGGEIKQSISGKVTHMICGEEAGPAKIAKAEKLKIKIINEDEFLSMIKTNPVTKNDDTPKSHGKSDSNERKNKSKSHDEIKSSEKKSKSSPSSKKADLDLLKNNNSNAKSKKLNSSSEISKLDLQKNKASTSINDSSPKKNGDDQHISPKSNKKLSNCTKSFYSESIDVKDCNTSVMETKPSTSKENSDIPLVEKYRPKTLKQVIGQHGDSSSANKLLAWLTKWYQSRKTKHPVPNPWSKGDGAYYKAVLLSGPPGVGKTTTANLVCKELGFDVVEFNASDTRSKNLLKDKITELTRTNSLSGYIQGKKALTKKHAIIMDEVDGMAGNEDRGGIQELLSIIKHTSVPIICICNDKSLQKMRSLVNNCYDLTFSRPRIEQIKGAIKSICFKEGIKISSDQLDEMINASSQDMRQIINSLSLWSITQNKSSDSNEKEMKFAKKDMKMGPWAVVKSVFSEEEHKNMSLADKSDLFFHDYSMAPLFVQQNYLKVVPHCPKKEHLKRFAQAADALSVGDLVESKIRSGMAWNLLPVQAMFSSVIPGTLLSGHVQGVIDFPGWLGQNSRAGKMNRLAQEIHSHTRLSTTGSKQSIRLDYASHLYNAVVNPLIEDGTDGVNKAIDVLQKYHLLREDLDSLLELGMWSGKSKLSQIDSKVKTALTKKYNKEAVPLPYSQVAVKKGKSAQNDGLEIDDVEGMEDESNHSDSDVENDAMIKKPKKVSATKNNVKKQPSKDVQPKSKPSKKK